MTVISRLSGSLQQVFRLGLKQFNSGSTQGAALRVENQSDSSLANIQVNNAVVSDGALSPTSATYLNLNQISRQLTLGGLASVSLPGLMSASDKNRLDSIATNSLSASYIPASSGQGDINSTSIFLDLSTAAAGYQVITLRMDRNLSLLTFNAGFGLAAGRGAYIRLVTDGQTRTVAQLFPGAKFMSFVPTTSNAITLAANQEVLIAVQVAPSATNAATPSISDIQIVVVYSY